MRCTTPLVAPFSDLELFDALHALLGDNYSGEDGLLPPSFLRYWEFLGPTWFQVMETRRLPDSIIEGLIFLIPNKGGDREEVR